MKTSQPSRKIPETQPVWHDFSWTPDGHTPKIDVQHPSPTYVNFIRNTAKRHAAELRTS